MLSIVIPVYNEEANIHPLYEKLKSVVAALGEHEILFIDDGSTDHTFARIAALHDEDSTVRCLRMRRNFGQTPALLAGFRAARGDIVVTMDGDLQNDPDDIPRLLDEMDGRDVVSGWRHDRQDSAGKRLASRFSNWLARRLTGLELHDFGCTLKAYRRESLEDLELYGEMHRYIPAVLAWQGFRVGEATVRHHERERGRTKYGVARLFRGLFDLINFKFWSGFSTRPLHFFGSLGGLLLAAGFSINLYLVLLKLLYGESLSDRPLLLLGVLLLVIGLQIFIFGFLAEIMVRSYYLAQRDKMYSIQETLD
ncbi:MAG: glycosyltransferase family 2 protein [Thermoplasmatota archaeon]